jgi:hypothetical protein
LTLQAKSVWRFLHRPTPRCVLPRTNAKPE